MKKIKIGIVQGRLSKKINNQIQAFPKKNWKEEFFTAKKIGFDGIEFIFDNLRNPLISEKGKKDIKKTKADTNLEIFSISCDYSMYYPLFGKSRKKTTQISKKLIESCFDLGIPRLALSLEDNSSILNKFQAREAITSLRKILNHAEKYNILVSLETSLNVQNIKKLIQEVGSDNLRINFDLGNSCSLGEITHEAILKLKNLIYSIHIKDRTRLFGTTVKLGDGDVDFNACFKSLKKINFNGNIVIQGARGLNDINTAESYLKFVRDLIKKSKLEA